MPPSAKPGRTLGLSLAIIASVVLFSLMPLLQVAFVLSVNRHMIFADGGVVAGSTILGISDTDLVFQTIVGLIFLVIAIFAWRGRPSSIRWIMLAAVLLLTLLTTALTISDLSQPQTLATGIDSSKDLSDTLLRGRLFFTIVIPLYVVWYMNRGPARAFYRGYYLPDPTQAAADQSANAK